MRGADDGFARREVRIVEHVGRAIYEPRRHAVLLQQLQQLARAERRRPLRDDLVEFLLVGAAGLVIAGSARRSPAPAFASP